MRWARPCRRWWRYWMGPSPPTRRRFGSMSFPEFMQETVLTPLRMTASTYEQPLPKERVAAAATGYYANGKQVEGKWHIYPEMAAAGLWTTASDLARFAIGIQQALAGKSNS